MRSFRIKERKRLLLIGDLLLINLAAVFALAIHAYRTTEVFGLAFLGSQILWFAYFSGLWVVASSIVGVYDVRSIAQLPKALQTLSFAFLGIFVVYLVIFFFTAPVGLLPRGIVIYQGILGMLFLAGWRWLFLAYAQKDFTTRKVIIVGAGWAGASIATAIYEKAQPHVKIIGYVDDKKTGEVKIIPPVSQASGERNPEDSPQAFELEIIGTSEDLRALVEQHGVSEVIVAVTHAMRDELYRAILDCRELGVQISPMSALYEYLTGRVPTEHIGENWYVSLPLDSPGGGQLYSIAKRAFDILSALLGLIVLLPLFPFLVLAIYLDSPGPVFYSQVRIGKAGKPFELLKLRTMIPHAEKFGPQRAVAEDPRLTRVGRFLRKTRLDEMPQLINVLKGEMSAVGPRPERPGHLEELEREIPFHRLRNAVKPGMAGWAVVNYGYVETLEDAKVRLQYDLYYVKHQSLWLDLRILLSTMLQVFRLKGR